MSSLIKIKPLGTTFVCSNYANKNFASFNKICTGSVHLSPSASINFKTLIKFDSNMFYDIPMDFSYLCLYVKNINSKSSFYSNNNFCIYKNETDFDINTVTWNTTPLTSLSIPFSIDDTSICNYVKIDISPYIHEWLHNKHNYGITIEPQNYYSSLIKFQSTNCQNPPFLMIKYKSPSTNVTYECADNCKL